MGNKRSIVYHLIILAAVAGLAVSSCSNIGLPPLVTTATLIPTATATPLPPTATAPPTETPTPLPTPTPVPGVRIAAGDQALRDGDWDQAISEFEAAAGANNGVDPELQAAALLGMGRAYFYRNENDKALDTLRQVIEDFPDAPQKADAYFYLGKVYADLDRYTDSADAYHNYLALRPGVIDSYIFETRGDLMNAAGDFSTSLNDYQAALQSPHLSNDLSLEVKVARGTALTGDYRTAIVMYKDIYNRAGDDYTRAHVDYLLGQTYDVIGQRDDANAAYLDAVTNYPLAYDSYLSAIKLVDAGYPLNELDRGLVDYFADQNEVALAAFDRYLENAPEDPATAYYYKGLILARVGNFESAILQWDQVIQSYPDSSIWDNAWEQKAYYQWSQLDKYPEAAKTLLDFVATAPTNTRAAEFLFDAARIQERSDQLVQAADTWDRVAHEYPTSSYAVQSLFLAGISRYRAGNYAAALETFQRLLANAADGGQRARAYFWMAKTQKAGGDDQGAQANWQQAVAADPTGYYSERARDILLNRPPFSPPGMYDITYDPAAEQAQAETWLKTTFSIPAEVSLNGPGELSNDPRFQRGAELWRLGEFDAARNEFEDLRTSVADNPADTYRLAVYFASIGLYRSGTMAARQVLSLAGMDDAATMNAPTYLNRLRFGTYYSNLVVPAAKTTGFDPLFLFSVIRQESLFESFSNSSAAARGLMQIIPATGQSLATRNNWPPNYTGDDLYRPLVSIYLGAAYLRDQQQFLGGDIFAALAAYNGGPGNAKEWQRLANGDQDLFLEIIRFDETHLYITRIYEIFSIYRQLYERVP